MKNLALKLDLGITIPITAKDYFALNKGVDAAKYLIDLLKDSGLPAENAVTDVFVRGLSLSADGGLVNLGDCSALLGSVATGASKNKATPAKATPAKVKNAKSVLLPYRGRWSPATAKPGFIVFLNKYGPAIHEMAQSGMGYTDISTILHKRHGDRFRFYKRDEGLAPSPITVAGYHYMWAHLNGVQLG